MHIDTMFPSKFLKAGDLVDRDFILCIASLSFDEFDRDDGGKEKRPVLWFTKTEKGFVLNKTNANMIASLHGSETDDWVGRLITLGTENVSFRGNIAPAIRVRGHVPNGSGQTEQQELEQESDLAGSNDDDLPF